MSASFLVLKIFSRLCWRSNLLHSSRMWFIVNCLLPGITDRWVVFFEKVFVYESFVLNPQPSQYNLLFPDYQLLPSVAAGTRKKLERTRIYLIKFGTICFLKMSGERMRTGATDSFGESRPLNRPLAPPLVIIILCSLWFFGVCLLLIVCFHHVWWIALYVWSEWWWMLNQHVCHKLM